MVLWMFIPWNCPRNSFALSHVKRRQTTTWKFTAHTLWGSSPFASRYAPRQDCREKKIKSTGTEVNHLHVATNAASTRYNPQAEGISIHCITIHGLTTTSMKCKWGAVSNTSCFCHVLCPYNTAEEEQYDHYSGRSSRKVQLNVYPWSIYHYRPIISPERFCLVPEENHTEPHLRFNCVLPPPRCWRSLVCTQKSEWTLKAEEQVLALSVDDAFLRVHQPLNLGRMRVKLT